MREEIDIEELARWRRQVDQAAGGYRGRVWNSEPQQLRIDFSRREAPEDWHDWFMTLLPESEAA